MTLAVGRLLPANSEKPLGSVFAVTRRLALTSFHCVREKNGHSLAVPRVQCAWGHATSSAYVQSWDEQVDVAVLRLNRPLPESLEPVPLTSDVASHDPFIARGAPVALDELHVISVSGTVIAPDSPMADGSPGIELFCDSAAAGLSLHGLSGGPVLTGTPQRAVGLIRWNPEDPDQPDRSVGGLVFAAPARRILEIWPELSPAADMTELLRRLSDPQRERDPVSVYADVRLLLTTGLHVNDGDIHVIPAKHGGRGRIVAIDKERVMICVEHDLSHPAVRAAAEREVTAAVAERSAYAAQQYIVMLTDGATWHLYHVPNGDLQLVDEATINSRPPGRLLEWLEAILGTGQHLLPNRHAIESKLGASSPSYQLDAAELLALYDAYHDKPTVHVKRQMWAKLLTTASGTSFTDNDRLFVDHSLLVATAKVIGHAVLGFQLDAPEISAKAIMSGDLFCQAKIGGVIEADFFDWITEVPGGSEFLMRLARRLSRFNWRHVDHDVLKQLYESVIPQATRHQLGEYYTPDWLAEAIIAKTIREPLRKRVLDPSCGSGTFVFHAIRSYLKAADADPEAVPPSEAVSSVVHHVIGIDVHPVAVTLARVTYLLAIGGDRLQNRPEFSVPVFLGDSMRWGQQFDLLTYDFSGLSVSTRLDPDSFVTGPAGPTEADFDTQLNFPDRIVADATRFDALVAQLADQATSREHKGRPFPPLDRTFLDFGIRPEEQPVLQQTFETMCTLHDDEKDHIWGYYVRNLARPTWLSRPANKVDVLIGNPPWLVYRYMTGRQQLAFREMSTERGMWAGGAAATNQDLAGLFVARCIELYLQPGGQFGYVMPWAVLPRPGQVTSRPYAGFRTGSYPTKSSDAVNVAFTQAWDLHQIKPSFFPVKACVVFGRRLSGAQRPKPLSAEEVELWKGRFETRRSTWADAKDHISTATAEYPNVTARESLYASKFAQGASIVPRVLFFVQPGKASPLGTVAGQRMVESRRSATEKRPWKHLDAVTGSVEADFIRPVYLGECVLPFRCRPPAQAIIPWDGHRLLADGDIELVRHPGLAGWLRKCEILWERWRSSDRLTLSEQLDYRNKLSRQFPQPACRVVYSKSGMYLAAATITDPDAVIDHKLYWSPVSGLNEARYLTAILNSSVLTMAVRPMQARGEHNPRDFDKYVFQIPIPLYDPGDAVHAELVVLAERAEQLAAAIELPDVRFERQRKLIRDFLVSDGAAEDIDAIVKTLIDATG
jgi:SAM-dependent methyltransferase